MTPASGPSPVFWLWLAGLTWTSVGVNLLSFGMVWTATAHSATLAGAVLVAVTLPRVVLGLFGGAIADRIGPAKVMLASDATMMCVTAAAAVAAALIGPHPALLLSVALLLGTADSFNLPAAGAVPKLLVPDAGLPRALAARQMVIFFASVIGPALGGAAVAIAGLPLSLALGSLGFAGMLLILLTVRRRFPERASAAAAYGISVTAQIREGLRFALTTPLLRIVLILTAGFALFALPLTSIIVPVAARESGWEPTLAGSAAGAFSLGMAGLALWVMWRSGANKAGAAAIAGMTLTGVGITGFGLSAEPLPAVLWVLIAGVGAGLFSTHIGPLFVAETPPEYMARVQAVMMIVQAAPPMIAGPVIGVLADQLPVGVVVLFWGAGTVLMAIVALLSRPLRTARKPGHGR